MRLLASLAIALLTGCASLEAWEPNTSQYPAKTATFHYVPDPSPMCGKPAKTLAGCTAPDSARAHVDIYLQENLPPVERVCYASHELMHAAAAMHRGTGAGLCARGRI